MLTCHCIGQFYTTRPRGYKKNFKLNSAEQEIFLLINVRMPTNIGILTFMSRENSILGLHKDAQILYLPFSVHLKF